MVSSLTGGCSLGDLAVLSVAENLMASPGVMAVLSDLASGVAGIDRAVTADSPFGVIAVFGELGLLLSIVEDTADQQKSRTKL